MLTQSLSLTFESIEGEKLGSYEYEQKVTVMNSLESKHCNSSGSVTYVPSSRSSDCSDGDTVKFFMWVPTFRRNMLSPSSGSNCVG
jgi:hypothetical protein